MVATDITIVNPNVNSGNAVTIFGGTMRYDWKNLTKSDPVEGKYDIVESHFGGFENPKIVVTGQFDADNVAGHSNVMNHALLVDFASCKSGTTTIKISLGTTPLVIGGRPTNGYETDGAQTLDVTNGIDVQIDSFSLSANVVIKYGQKVDFTIIMHETD